MTADACLAVSRMPWWFTTAARRLDRSTVLSDRVIADLNA